MSEALYTSGGLRFWNEEEIKYRERLIQVIPSIVEGCLKSVNNGWDFRRVEGPTLAPRSCINAEYGEDDLFMTNHVVGGEEIALRAETTHSSYAMARVIEASKKYPFPLCVWQSGKSYRRERSDGARASKLRFNEFYQLEFQCLYSSTTMTDYREYVVRELAEQLQYLTQSDDMQIIKSDRIPNYSTDTIDIELWQTSADEMREVASISLRTDYDPDVTCLEIAIGLDRLVEIATPKARRANC